MFADNETTMRGCTVGGNNAGCELNGSNSHIVDCQFNDTTVGFALFAGDGSLVDGCSFTENGGNAISAGSFISVTSAASRDNGTAV